MNGTLERRVYHVHLQEINRPHETIAKEQGTAKPLNLDHTTAQGGITDCAQCEDARSRRGRDVGPFFGSDLRGLPSTPEAWDLRPISISIC